MQRFVDRLRKALRGEPVVFADMRSGLPLTDADFADAYHLQWHGANLLSRKIAHLIESSYGQVAEPYRAMDEAETGTVLTEAAHPASPTPQVNARCLSH